MILGLQRTLKKEADFQIESGSNTPPPRRDELSREVFGILGIPIDRTELAASIDAVEGAVQSREPFLLSTPNVNFLISSQADEGFRETLLSSDLCPADGMPVVWIARLLGIPVKERVSGADLFEALKVLDRGDRRIKVFLFGGASDLAARIGESLNAHSSGLKCVGALNPGFCSVEEMSSNSIIDAINASGADFLAVFLSAQKAQAWLLKNHDRLRTPVRAQLGAAVNFEAGIVKRAPAFVRLAGFEWLWRIKEEPYLWRRYWSDGKSLLQLVATHLLPLMATAMLIRMRGAQSSLEIELHEKADSIIVHLTGFAAAAHIDKAIEIFGAALNKEKSIAVDLSQTVALDPRFFGLLLMTRKRLRQRGQKLRFFGASPKITRAFRRNGFDYLLSE
jgi:N-acetylglucosaminyldiphosphoundecaprenol N-acetyl-beta-D-mannosaminyltransferase